MNRAIITGYYGEENTGDDAFLAVSAWGCVRYLGHRDLFATMRTPVHFNGSRIRPIYSPSLKGTQGLFERFHAGRAQSIVFGGGSNFHTSSIIQRYIKLVRRSNPGPHYAVGVSIGPFKNKKASGLCGELLSMLTFVGLRDQVSLERAKEIAPNARLELTFDIAPLLPFVREDLRGNGVFQEEKGGERYGLGVALCNNMELSDSEITSPGGLIPTLTKSIERLKRINLVDEVVLIDFNGHPRYKDEKLHNALANILKKEIPVRYVPYSSDPFKAYDEISKLRALIAMRLHAAVFGFTTHTPTLMLAYHEKCLEWAKTVGIPDGLVVNVERVSEKNMYNSIHYLLSCLPLADLPVAEAKHKALANWTWTQRGQDIPPR